jgi:hypothetical protein
VAADSLIHCHADWLLFGESHFSTYDSTASDAPGPSSADFLSSLAHSSPAISTTHYALGVVSNNYVNSLLAGTPPRRSKSCSNLRPNRRNSYSEDVRSTSTPHSSFYPDLYSPSRVSSRKESNPFNRGRRLHVIKGSPLKGDVSDDCSSSSSTRPNSRNPHDGLAPPPGATPQSPPRSGPHSLTKVLRDVRGTPAMHSALSRPLPTKAALSSNAMGKQVAKDKALTTEQTTTTRPNWGEQDREPYKCPLLDYGHIVKGSLNFSSTCICFS